MRHETNELLQQLRAADWFASVGRPLEPAVREWVVPIRSWKEAVACCSSAKWENFTLEMGNQLTMFLHAHARERFRRWNDIVNEVKASLTPLVKSKLAPLNRDFGPPESQTAIKNTVQWDILGACMELEYADVREPGFFNGLMTWYVRGRFPCGWGERSAGGQVHLFGPVDESNYDPNEQDPLK